MALSVKVGSFVANTITGNQATTDPGFTPKALILWTSGRIAVGNDADYRYAIGFATGVSDVGSMAVASDDTDTTDAARRAAVKALTIIDPTGALDGECDFVSFDANGFTINWTDAPAAAYIINYLAIGGTDVTGAFVKRWTLNDFTGLQAVTGIGFKPDFVAHLTDFLSAALPASSADARLGFGVMDKGGGEWAVGMMARDAQPTSDTRRGQRTDRCLIASTTSGASLQPELEFSSMDADGFTVNVLDDTGAADHVFSLCLAGPRFKARSFDKSTGVAPASQDLTGIGFTPKAALLAAIGRTIANTMVDHAQLALGGASSTSQRKAATLADTDGAAIATPRRSQADRMLTLLDEATPSTVASEADLSAFGTDDLTLSWNPNDASADQILYLAIGAKPSVAITDPPTNGFDITTTSYTIDWAYTDNGVGQQGAYKVVVKDNTGAIMQDSGKVLSSSARSYLIIDLPQGATNWSLEVTVWDADDVQSVTAVRTFDVVYTQAAVPTFTPTNVDADGYINIAIDNPTPQQAAFDTATESIRTEIEDPYTFSHTPSGTPRGVIVTAAHGTSSTDHIVGITYGGVAMTRVRSDADTVGEPGRSYLYFLGAAIPTGPQTVSVDLASATTDDIQFLCQTVTAPANTEVLDHEGTSGDQANPQVILDPGTRPGLAFGVIYSGHDAASNLTVLSGMTGSGTHDHNFGTFSSRVRRQTSASHDAFTFGYTATSEDVALSVVSVGVVGGDPGINSNEVHRKLPSETNWVRIATGVAADGNYRDYAAASGVTYDYKVRAIGDNSTTRDSASAQDSLTLPGGMWLHVMGDAQATIRKFGVLMDRRNRARRAESQRMQFAGRDRPVVEFGELEEESVDVRMLALTSGTDLAALRTLYERRATLCYRDERGRKVFGVLESLPEDDGFARTEADVTITATDFDEAV